MVTAEVAVVAAVAVVVAVVVVAAVVVVVAGGVAAAADVEQRPPQSVLGAEGSWEAAWRSPERREDPGLS